MTISRHSDTTPLSQLWVCWTKPERLPSKGVPLLSFLMPSLEEDLQREHQGPVIFAREASRAVRSEARTLYINLAAKIGTVPCGNGPTLRQALTRRGEASRWWYHPVAFKSCESDPTFQWIIAVLTIRAVAEKLGLKKLVLVGAPWEVTAALKRAFTVEERHTRQPQRVWWIWLRSLAARTLYAMTALRLLNAVRRHTQTPQRSFDVIFSGFWDWSVWWDNHTQSLADRYFKRLPEELKRRGISSIGWFAWFDPHSEPGKEGRRLKDVLAPIKGQQDVVILQSFLSPRDIIKAVGDFRPLATFLKVRHQSAFREVFQENEFDYYPLFSGLLLRGFLDTSLPRCDLVALATERACRRYRPKVTLSFLEHFPYSRAHYEGVRRAGIGTTCYAVQHASYNHEKTFLFLHPFLEFKGEPDGYAVPHPDYVCAMGTLGQELFLECGYPKERVLLTGSPRYDHVRALLSGDKDRLVSNALSSKKAGGKGRHEKTQLLLVSSLHLDTELEMIDAVCAATQDVTGIKLLCRNHPFRRIELHPGFAQYKDRIEFTHGSLDEDLAQADLILFTYSTVTEEAVLRGKPVWQWLAVGFNGSALAEVVAIPQFGSVASLREALRDFRAEPSRFLPGAETRQLVLERLFYLGDGEAAKRIADVILELLSSGVEGVKVEDPTRL